MIYCQLCRQPKISLGALFSHMMVKHRLTYANFLTLITFVVVREA